MGTGADARNSDQHSDPLICCKRCGWGTLDFRASQV